ncbi:response regulator [Paenibacillus sp. J5C_2022]|uniref:response regulator n=1 Tax=Paenibacillus sp. J5C2022 TaxID=2977129 RepID=UPI0021D0A367|nr:response regulator [Paenibacillus sp. J5C2022]MCU6708870.1 response regulator [Paenibacillus sp. J5C2022]
MRVVIIDDDQAMLTVMKRRLARMEGIEVAASMRQVPDALDYFRNHTADLAFIDIEIAGDNGLQLARELRERHQELDIVFVTSHREYALDAFEAYPLDYMVKPISAPRLSETVERARRKRQGQPAADGDANELKQSVIQGLGGLTVSGPLDNEVKWISSKSKELFAFLLLNRGKNVSRSLIIEQVFPDMPLNNSKTYLHTAVYQLRKALSSQGLREMVVSNHDQYRLELASVEVDFIDFEHKVAALGDIHESSLEDALTLEQQYAGELFGELSYLWAMPEQERLGYLYDNFAKRLIRTLMDGQQVGAALPVARKLVRRQELDEEANLLLMQTLGGMKDWKALQDHYERFRELLKRELGIKPSFELAGLFKS